MPPRGSLREAKEFAQRHGGWIAARLQRLPQAAPFADGTMVPLRGMRIASCIGRARAARCGPRPARTAMPLLCVAGEAPHVDRRVRDFLEREAQRDLEAASRRAAEQLGVEVKRISVRDQSSRWGSCSTTGVLSYSWRLILAPPFVLDYLAAHEVAHLIEMNHSRRFWRLVERLCPDASAPRLGSTRMAPTASLRPAGPAAQAVRARRPSIATGRSPPSMLRPDTFALTAAARPADRARPGFDGHVSAVAAGIGRLFGAPAAQVQLTLSAYLIGFACGQIVLGPFSDRHGRKPVLLAALALFLLATSACALCDSIELLIAARILQALGGIGRHRAGARDRARSYAGARAAANFRSWRAIMALAPFLAPLLGGVLQTAVRLALELRGAVASPRRRWSWSGACCRRRCAARAGAVFARLDAALYRGFLARRGFVAHLGIGMASWPACSPGYPARPSCCRTSTGSRRWFGAGLRGRRVGYLVGTASPPASWCARALDRTIGFGAAASRSAAWPWCCVGARRACPSSLTSADRPLSGRAGPELAAVAWPARCCRSPIAPAPPPR